MASSIPHSESPHYVARYIENFIDLVENIPNDLARRISQVHELQLDYENTLSRLERTLGRFVSGRYAKDETKQLKLVLSTQHCLLRIQEISDNKLAIIQEALDQLDIKSRELDYDYRLINAESSDQQNNTVKDTTSQGVKTTKNVCSNKSQASTSTSQSQSQSGRERGSGSNDLRESPEPTYCVCHQVSYGDMICCDNDACDIEWFHFQCVSLTSKPKGKWYCPNCRGDRSNQPKK